jgi:hypothetical protein
MTRALVLASALLAACSAAPNPARERLEPASPARAQPAAAETSIPAAAAKQQEPAPAAKSSDEPPAPAERAAAELALGTVGGEPIGAREFVQRLWVRDHALARTVLEQIVFARTAMLEADRLGLSLAPDVVDAEVARATRALEEKLAASAPGTSVDDYVRDRLDLDPAWYRLQLRADAIAQLLAERCVRAWLFESERAVVRITEIESEEALGRARADLERGLSFDAVALAHGRGEDEATRTTRMVVARAETQELARLAFATPVGSVGGPMAESGRYLYLVVDERREPSTATGAALAVQVEKSLADEPVDNLEYVQWRAAMSRRYQVRFDALRELFELPGR